MLAAGVAREVARLSLPVGVLSSMYATCNARSLMHFLSLRTKDERAKVKSFPQWEIELVARKMEAEWARLMPLTHEAFNRSEEHTSELQSLMRISYAVFCLKKKKNRQT